MTDVHVPKTKYLPKLCLVLKLLAILLVIAVCSSLKKSMIFYGKLLLIAISTFKVESFSNMSVNVVDDNFLKGTCKVIEMLMKTRFDKIGIFGCNLSKSKNQRIFLSDMAKRLSLNNSFYLYIQHTDKMSVLDLKQINAFLIEDHESFKCFSLTTKRFQLVDNFLIVMLGGYFKELQEIFEFFLRKELYSVYAIYQANNEVIISTFIPFQGPNLCRNSEPKVIAKFSNGTFEGTFPREINFNLCPVRVVTFHNPDFMIVKKFANGSNDLSGLGIELIDMFARGLNYTNQVTVNNETYPWGMVYSDDNITGCLGSLHRNQADLSLTSSILNSQRVKYFDPSVPLMMDSTVFVIPPGKPYGHFEKLTRPFSLTVWIFIIVTIAVAVLTILLTNTRNEYVKSIVYGHGVKTPMTNLILTIVGLGQTRLPSRSFSRFILMMFIILCLVLRSIYQGSLYEFLQSDQRHKEVESVEEMVKNDFTFYAREIYMDDLKDTLKSYKSHSNVLPIDAVWNTRWKMTGEEKVSFLETLGLIHNKMDEGFKVKYLKDPFATVSAVLYFRKNFFLREHINTKITRLVSSGFLEYWNRGLYKQHTGKQPKRLKVKDFYGTFALLLMGLIIGFVLFVFEILHKRFYDF